MILIIDNFDSFTFNLVDYFFQLGIESDVLRNTTPVESIDIEKYDGIVLSPGPEHPQKAGLLMEYIHVFHQKKALLGICLGHQAIGQYFGATLTNATLPVHGKTRIVNHTGDQLFCHIPSQFKAVRYHSLVLKDLTKNIVPIAYSSDDEIMALRHGTLPIYGIQYHPESILTEFGLTILKNWINLLNIEP